MCHSLPLKHPPTQPGRRTSKRYASPPTIALNSASVPLTNHELVSMATSLLSSIIKFLAAKRMKEDQERGKSRAQARGGRGSGEARG